MDVRQRILAAAVDRLNADGFNGMTTTRTPAPGRNSRGRHPSSGGSWASSSLVTAGRVLAPLLTLRPEIEETAETCIRLLVPVVQFDSPITRTDADLHRCLVPAVGLAPAL